MLMETLIPLFACISAIAAKEQSAFNRVTSCVTPNNDRGVCVQVRNCPVFVNALSSGSTQCYAFIRASQCGPDNVNSSRTRVCCGRYSDYLEKLPPVSCKTPNRDQGRCVEVRQCSIFIDGLVLGKTDNYDFIRESNCGFENGDQSRPKVCCGPHADYLYKLTPKPTGDGSTVEGSQAKKSPFPLICGNQSHDGEEDGYQDRIIGGKTARVGEFPWMARLRHIRAGDGYQQYGCAGFLISERFVLTAAHCIMSARMRSSVGPIHQVVLGHHRMEGDPDCATKFDQCENQAQFLTAGTPIVHPQYSDNDQYHNDIAILPLAESAKFSDDVYPICLPRTLSDASSMWVAGWGKTEKAASSTVKLKLELPIVNISQCIRQYGVIGVEILDKQICAGGIQGRDTCVGDSGGPIMSMRSDYRWYAEGIVSYGKYCGTQGWPGVYTSISQYMPWIEKMVNQYLESHEDGHDRK